MRNQIIYYTGCLLFLASCNQSPKQEINQKNTEKTLAQSSDSISANKKWMHAINNKDIKLLSSLYTENAMVLSENGLDLANREEILKLVPNSDFLVKSVSTTQRIQANATYDYEIGDFVNKDGGLAKHLIIWNTSNNKDKRELEFIVEVDESEVDLEEITMQRQKWMTLCNAHDAKSLVEQVYAENIMYYNRGHLLQGRSAIVTEYQYMNNPEYNLVLNPILVEPVSETIVYEFGQCKGSYNGKYILVWQKKAKGVWQVLFDSNI